VANAAACLFLADQVLAQTPCGITRLSVGISEGNEDSLTPSVSAYGRFVTFSSRSYTLVAGDNNNQWDIFRIDRDTGIVSLESRSSSGELGNRISRWSSTSADGRYIAFESSATNLVANDDNFKSDIFVRDTLLGTTGRVNINSSGVEGNGSSSLPRISSNGSLIVFSSQASNLVGGDTNGKQDIFVKDRTTGVLSRVSVNTAGIQANNACGGDHSFPGCSISDDGRSVVFESYATNLVTPDTNLESDVFLRDRVSSTTIRVSSTPQGGLPQGSSLWPMVSPFGQWITFTSTAPDLVAGDSNGVSDVFLYELATGAITRLSEVPGGAQANGASYQSNVSADGRFVGFISEADNLVAGDQNGLPDTFVLDRQFGRLTRASVSNSGEEAQGMSISLVISADGRTAVFSSPAPNLVPGDNNVRFDVFATAAGIPPPAEYCVSTPNSLGCVPRMGFDGCPSASLLSGFTLKCADVRNAQRGWIVYGLTGAASVPFQNGTLCVQSPLSSTVIVDSGGHPPPWNLCDGLMSLDFTAFAAGSLGGTPDPALRIPGTLVHAQWMGSDPIPGAAHNVMLSGGLMFTLAP